MASAILLPPPVPVVGGGGGLVAVALFTDLFGLGPSKSKAWAPQTKGLGLAEFPALNGNPQFSDLLNQTAGGSSNTLDILR
jgi:hypothetical protein